MYCTVDIEAQHVTIYILNFYETDPRSERLFNVHNTYAPPIQSQSLGRVPFWEGTLDSYLPRCSVCTMYMYIQLLTDSLSSPLC